MTVAFDHLMVMVDDEEHAAEAFRHAGYAVTPRSALPGMANRLVCFPTAIPYAASFIELLAIHRRDEVPPAIRAFLGDGLGPRAIVVAVEDMEAYGARLKELGVQFAGPMSIRRQWTLDTGEVLDVHLEILLPRHDPELVPWVAVKHHTVHHYLRDEFVRHDNGQTHLGGVLLSCSMPQELAAKLAHLWQAKVLLGDGVAVIRLAGVDILIEYAQVPDDRSEPRIIGAIVHDGSSNLTSTDAESLRRRFQGIGVATFPAVPGFSLYGARR